LKVSLSLAGAGAAAVIALSYAFYVPLISALHETRPAVVEFWLRHLLPVAGVHVVVLVVSQLICRWRMLTAFALWGVSFATLLALGGAQQLAVSALVAAAAAALVVLGDGPARFTLPPTRLSWGVRLGFGILGCSVVGAWLCVLGAFTGTSVGLTLAIALAWTVRKTGGALVRELVQDVSALAARWDLPTALGAETAFLLAAFAFVGASAPESRSDAIRVYWPYVKLLEHLQGFFDIRAQWGYVIPQAGLTYAAGVLVVFGSRAVRYAMLLSLLALFGILVNRGRSSERPAAWSLALLLASCPIMLWTSLSLYQDAFVCLATVVLGLVCIDGSHTGSPRHWASIGALCGVAWCAKFSTITYAFLVCLIVLVRSGRTGWLRSLGRAGLQGSLGFFAAAGPWLWHSLRGTANPVFPFLGGIFPSPDWPADTRMIEFGRLDLLGGLRELLVRPVELTYRTDRFVEAAAGSLGILIPTLLILAVLTLPRMRGSLGAWWLAGFGGTGLLWLIRPYVRYWLPGVWLLGIGAVPAVEALAASPRRRLVVAAGTLVLVLSHPPFEMVTTWSDFVGWPWDLYRGAIDEDAYLLRQAGFPALRRLEALDPGWPKLWYTGTELVGNIRAIPLLAAAWELRLHAAGERAAAIRHLGAAGCDYWVVQTDSPQAEELRALGIADPFWTEENLIDSEGMLEVYRMPASKRAAALVSRHHGVQGRTLLSNGGFEHIDGGAPDPWAGLGTMRWRSGPSEAHTGRGSIEVAAGASAVQAAQLPPGIRTVRLTQWVRSAEEGRPVTARLQINWLDASGEFLTASIIPVPASAEWKRYGMTAPVPRGATAAMVYLTSHDRSAAVLFDDVDLMPSS
jgi:hypothetical protein